MAIEPRTDAADASVPPLSDQLGRRMAT